MDDFTKVLQAKVYMDKLSKGIDPISDMNFPDDTILNNKKLSKCFETVSEILEHVLRIGGRIPKSVTNQKYTFQITKEEIDKVVISQVPIPISTFVYSINEVVDTKYMRKLRATQITSWLVSKGYLKETEHEDGKVFKVVTEKAKEVGISGEPKTNGWGRKYEVNLYNENAQRFILYNLNDIMVPGTKVIRLLKQNDKGSDLF